MSQAKVDRYKEEKKNREKIMKKEKRNSRLMKLGGTVIAVVLVGWIGYSVYLNATNKAVGSGATYSVDTAAVEDFLNNMSVEESEATAETEVEAGTEAAETEAAETEEATTETQE